CETHANDMLASWSRLALCAGAVVLAAWSLIITSRLVRLQDDTGPVFLEQPVETVVAPSPLFLLWAYDFSMRTDSGFMLEFAAELIALGYRVVMESPSDGALPQRLYPQHAFTARVNPHLQKVLSGHSGAARNAIDAIGESPEFIVCFSSLWAPFFLQMPDKNDLRAIWYFYTPQRCDTSKETSWETEQIGKAMAKAHKVVFASVSLLHEGLTAQNRNQLRQIIRAEHHLRSEDFMITVFGSDPCKTGRDLLLGHVLNVLNTSSERSWFVASFGSTSIAQRANFISFDWTNLGKYLAAADLHVSLSWQDFPLDTLYARALSVPVLAPISELAEGNSLDGSFALPDLTEGALETSLETILRLSAKDLSAIGKRGRVAVEARFAGPVVQTRMSHLLDIFKAPKLANWLADGPRIGIFIQMHDPSRFHQLRQCIFNTLTVAGNGTVDIFLITTQPLEQLFYMVKRIVKESLPALRFVVTSRADNKGADIGLFLHQLLLAKELSFDHDLILKLHTKRDKPWRERMVREVCGSTQLVRKIIEKFSDPTIGMIGPSSFTWTKVGRKGLGVFGLGIHAFSEVATVQMRTAWSLISPAGLPPQDTWTIVAGSFYWVRAGLKIWEEKLLNYAPTLLDVMGPYKSGCNDFGCNTALGLERVMPTLVATTFTVATELSINTANVKNSTRPAALEDNETHLTASVLENTSQVDNSSSPVGN
ncbi:unnamed protein product, partial [Durusdinium trenchii]